MPGVALKEEVPGETGADRDWGTETGADWHRDWGTETGADRDWRRQRLQYQVTCYRSYNSPRAYIKLRSPRWSGVEENK